MAAFVEDFVEEDMETTIKVLCLGPSSSGKSTIMSTLMCSPPPTGRTVSVQYSEKKIGQDVILMVYDMVHGGLEEYCHGCGGVIVVCDLLDARSYGDAIKELSVNIGKIVRTVPSLPPIIVCFTKVGKVRLLLLLLLSCLS